MNISGSNILITGGTGSFGNRVAAHMLKQSPAKVRIFSRDEKKQWEMQQAFPQFEYVVGDVREEELFYTVHPEYNVPEHRAEKPLGTEYTSANASELEAAADIEPLLEKMGDIELYI
jgi:nucleoside-diphosphate-sugar epimerase